MKIDLLDKRRGSIRTLAYAEQSQTHHFDPEILRESDIRGIVGEDLKVEDAYFIGRSFGSIVRLCGGDTIAVGYDGRLSSPELATALMQGLKQCGLRVHDIGLGPSPMLYYAVHAYTLHGGIMVTGSHNPGNYNGFKMMLGNKSFFGSDIQKLKKIAAKGEFLNGDGRIIDHPVQADYISRLLQEKVDLSNLRIAWDPGNGAAGEVTRKLSRKLKGEHILINCDIDGTFPAHHPDPTVPENLKQLIDVVVTKKCDLGIAFDGDGDRIGVVDGAGRILWGDQLMQLFAREVLEAAPGASIIADVKASQSLFDMIEDAGGNPVMWKTGHSLIKSKMVETNAPLAGEMSGHLFFADRYYGFDDALYAAIRLLSLIARQTKTPKMLFDTIPCTINTPELRFDCAETEKRRIVDQVRNRLKKAGAKMNCIDGVRVETTNGWWLLRASNTQAVLVARCESHSKSGLEKLYAELSHYLRLGNYTGNIPVN